MPDYAELFAGERRVLLRLLDSLDAADWVRPTPCPGWSVLDLCAHLVGDDLSMLARHRDGHPGPLPEGDFVAWLNALQDAWVAAARRLSPRLAIDLLAWTGPQVVEFFRGQDLLARTARVSWAGPDPVPVWLDQARELSEFWIHRQQLLDALGRPNDLDPAVLGPILDGLRWAYPYRLSTVTAPPGASVVIDITGPVNVRWVLVCDADGGWAFTDDAGTEPVARLALTTDQAWRLLSGNLPAASPIDAHGDPGVVDVLLATRAVIL